MATSNLPLYATPLIGRDAEIDALCERLADPSCRLLSLVGPGGIGKTRLAIEAARLQQDSFVHGAILVSLQPLTSPEFIIPAIAEALRFHFYAVDDPKHQLLDYLREKTLLLVLDNFEHLLDSVQLVSEILASAPEVKVLATSRERLNLLEEWVLDIQGLSAPASEAVTEIDHYDAVRLFLQSAQRVQVGFTLTDAQKPAVVRICRLVGGIPLGIELAAAWVRVLLCEEIATEIERGLDLLATSARNVEPRHRSMRVVLDHSWNLLTEDERNVFKKLSGFRGGFRREAAQQVAAASLQILSVLVDKSLIRLNANGRYEMHELPRQYGEEHLKISGETEIVWDALCAYYAEYLYRREDDLKGARQQVAVGEIEEEIDNVRTSWRWAVTRRRFQDIEKSLWSLLLFFEIRGWLKEGEETFEQAIQTIKNQPEEVEDRRVFGQLYAWQSWFSVRLGHYQKARDLLHLSLSNLHQLPALQARAFALVCLGAADIYLGLYDEADEVLQEGLTIFGGLGDRFGLAWTLENQAKLSRVMGQYNEAKSLSQESIAIWKDQVFGLADTLIHLGQIVQEMGDFQEAKRLYLESLEVAEKFPMTFLRGYALVALGEVSFALQSDEEASVYFHQALQIAEEIGALRLQLDALLGITALLMKLEDEGRTVERLAFILQHPASRIETRVRVKALLEQLESQLPSDVFAICLENGRRGRLDYILESIYETSQFSRFRTGNVDFQEPSTNVEAKRFDQSVSLTEREHEILDLMALGMSNREIAEKLLLSVGTVKWYGSQICSKLHARNRVQAIARARALGILP